MKHNEDWWEELWTHNIATPISTQLADEVNLVEGTIWRRCHHLTTLAGTMRDAEQEEIES
jgi:hypothetical protein